MTISEDFIIQIATAGVAIAGALTAVINALIAGKRSAKLAQQLEQAKERETYATCPHCGKKIHLSEMSFRLPSGALDNNLDGKPDED